MSSTRTRDVRGGGPNSGKTQGYRAVLDDGRTKRTDRRSQAAAYLEAHGPGHIARIVRNHNGTQWEEPTD